jgi:hypothetical protein
MESPSFRAPRTRESGSKTVMSGQPTYFIPISYSIVTKLIALRKHQPNRHSIRISLSCFREQTPSACRVRESTESIFSTVEQWIALSSRREAGEHRGLFNGGPQVHPSELRRLFRFVVRRFLVLTACWLSTTFLAGCSATNTQEIATAKPVDVFEPNAFSSLHLSISGEIESARLIDPLSRVGCDPTISTPTIPGFDYYVESIAALDDPEPWNEALRLAFEDPVAGDYALEITRSSEPGNALSLSCRADRSGPEMGTCTDGRLLSANAGETVTVRFVLRPAPGGKCSLKILEVD